jgi:hypothetical protein
MFSFRRLGDAGTELFLSPVPRGNLKDRTVSVDLPALLLVVLGASSRHGRDACGQNRMSDNMFRTD